MRISRLRNALFCAFLAGAPARAFAQPSSGDYQVDVSVSIGGEAIDSVDVFYDRLSPYGVWLDEPDLGQVFVPDSPRFVPYADGHWVYTDVGFVWVSTQPFEWATAHYGRWAFSRYYGRWVWRPDTTWGPAWVEWRESGDDLGWAPLGPDVAIQIGYEPPIEAWHYCGAAHVLDRNVARYYEPHRRVIEMQPAARPIEHYAVVSGARVIAGPPPETLRQRRIDVRPTRVDAHQVGRWTPAETTAAVKHATDNRASIDAQNRKRIERNPKLRVRATPAPQAPQVQRTPARPAPAPTPTKPEPKRAQRPPAQRTPAPVPQPPQVKRTPEPARPAPAPTPTKPEPKRAQRPPAQRAPAPTPTKPEPKRAQRPPAQPAPAPQPATGRKPRTH